MITNDSHYLELAAAYARGALRKLELEDGAAIAAGQAAGLKLHRFKRTAELARIRPVLGALRGFGATSLVDLGSGRGTFVWPLLDELPELQVIATDVLEQRVQMFAEVAAGGVARLSALRADMTALPLGDGSVECVTALEVLEHLPGDRPVHAAREALRVARTAVLVTVPSHEDNNPEHVQLFDRASLTEVLRSAGARRVSIEYVLNHIVAVARR